MAPSLLSSSLADRKKAGENGGKYSGNREEDEPDEHEQKLSLEAAQANNIKQMYTTALVSAQSWDIFSPPP